MIYFLIKTADILSSSNFTYFLLFLGNVRLVTVNAKTDVIQLLHAYHAIKILEILFNYALVNPIEYNQRHYNAFVHPKHTR